METLFECRLPCECRPWARLHPKYDRYFNGHYDFRPLGIPLGEDVLPDAITACEQLVAGTA